MSAQSDLLVIFGDQHRGEALGCAGNPDVQTPTLDRLAAEGVRFTHAYANTPVCTPSRGSLLTGQWPHRHRALSNDLPLDAGPHTPTIARSLRMAGYRCGYIGKWHLGGWPRGRFIPPGPERLGFDDFWAAWNCAHRYFEPQYHLNDSAAVIAPTGRYEPEVQTDLALSWLGDHERGRDEQPFCLCLSYGPPHDPYWPAPPGLADRYRPEALHLRPNCPDTPEVRRDLAGYYAHITALDAQIERLLSFLRSGGMLDNTLVVFTSDHGDMLGSHGRRNKQVPWEEAVNIPLLLRFGNRLPQGTTDDLLIGLVDVTPTILGLLDVPVPAAMQGADLADRIRGRGGPRPSSVYLQEALCCDQAIQAGIATWRGVRTARYTYARDLNGPWVHYDNVADPYQVHNLVGEPTVSSVQAALETELQAWMDRLDDPLDEPAAMLARYGLTQAWAARTAHFRRG